MDISQTQQKVLMFLADAQGPRNLTGHGRAPYMSAARALVRKGLAYQGTRTGHYGATEAGRTLIKDPKFRSHK